MLFLQKKINDKINVKKNIFLFILLAFSICSTKSIAFELTLKLLRIKVKLNDTQNINFISNGNFN